MKTKLRLAVIAVLLLASAPAIAAAAGWNAARWQALFVQVPAPPSTLAAAGGSIGAMKDREGHVALGPTGSDMAKSRAEYHAGILAMNTAAVSGSGIDVARLQNDPAYAARFQEKMATMSVSEKMQFAMKMRQTTAAPNAGAIRAYGSLESYLMGDGGHAAAAAKALVRGGMSRITSHYNVCHADADKQLQSALKACAPAKECGDTDCSPVPACIATIEARVPAMIARHHECAASELGEEHALFAKARETLAPVVAKTVALTGAAEKAGVAPTQLNAGYSAILNDVALLQQMDARIELRAGYWQGIQRKTVPDSYFVSGNLGYRYMLGKDDILAAPDDAPDGW